jgi:hypothetical protein
MTEDKFYTFGQAFLVNFYTIYDYGMNRVGVFLHKDSRASLTLGGGDGPSKPVSSFPAYGVALIIIFILCALAAVGAFFYIRRRNERLKETLEEYNSIGNIQ